MLNCVLVTQNDHSGDCDADHSQVTSKVRLWCKKIHHSKQKRNPRINTASFISTVEADLRDCPNGQCVLAPTLFGIFFSLLLSYNFSQSDYDIYLCTKSNRNPLKAHEKRLFSRFSCANKELLTISLEKTNIIGQDMDAGLNMRIGRAETSMARLAKRIWDNAMLTINTKMKMKHGPCTTTKNVDLALSIYAVLEGSLLSPGQTVPSARTFWLWQEHQA